MSNIDSIGILLDKKIIEERSYYDQLRKVKDRIFNTDSIEEINNKPALRDDGSPIYVIFISICDSKKRARVFKGIGNNLEAAWEAVTEKTIENLRLNKSNAKWVKIDIVKDIKNISKKEFKKSIGSLHNNFYRKGIAFDDMFENAWLEAELNSNKIIDYKKDKLSKKNLGKYLRLKGENKIEEIPNKFYEFSTHSFFIDENMEEHELYEDENNFGRRIIDRLTKETVLGVIEKSATFLLNSAKPNGKFKYGFFPAFDKEIDNYNILRHTGALWSLLLYYKINRDDKILERIERGIKYLIQDALVFKDHETAFILERKSDEIKLGGNAIAIILLTEYMSEVNTDKYREIAVYLGNGIVELQDASNGKFYHILNYPGFDRKEEQRTIYYDGESAYALSMLYGLTENKKWLDAAKSAIDNFIDSNYLEYVDHWVSYAVNEFTKYVPEEKYFEFGFKNAFENLEWIASRETTYHIYSELLLQTQNMYIRSVNNNLQLDILDKLDYDRLVEVINYRVWYSLNAFFYPEYAMYFKNPERILNSFFIRQGSFRVRIDDIQHFIGGFYHYYINYEHLNR